MHSTQLTSERQNFVFKESSISTMNSFSNQESLGW